MKVTDLMVGDWVNYKSQSSGKPSPIKIENIYGVEFNCEVEYWNIKSGYSISDTEPIELTEEILVKNSIKISSFTGTLYWFDEDEHCCIKPIENRFMFMYSKGADYLTFRITYVHQLQHLIRLADVQKEIEL